MGVGLKRTPKYRYDTNKGFLGQIIPVTWTGNAYYQELRKYLFETNSLAELIMFDGLVFADANVDTSIVIASPHGVPERHFYLSIAKPNAINQKVTLRKPYQVVELSERLDITPIVTVGWDDLMPKVYSISVRLGEITSHISLGLRVSSIEKDTSDDKNESFPRPLFLGDNIERYEPLNPKVFFNPREVTIVGGTKNPEVYRSHPKILLQSIRNLSLQRRIIPSLDTQGEYFGGNVVGIILRPNQEMSIKFVLAVLASNFLNSFFAKRFVTISLTSTFLSETPIRRISFTTPAAERAQITQQAIVRYDASDNAALLAQTQAAIDADKTDVIHDLLAHLAQRMIDLNKQKQAEVKRFLGWLEGRLKIRPGKDGAAGIDSLTGKSILQNYLGDYQKGEHEEPWREFHYRLHQNRNRFAVSLSDVEGEIEREYEHSLTTLLPIKRELARTDTLIDKIVYGLYGLTDAEIELIERPQYEQALTDAKARVVADEQITDDEIKIDKIAENILPAAERFFERVAPKSDEETLDQDLPSWRTLPAAAPTFLLTGDYNLRTLPEQMDFSTCIIPYTKAVEVVLFERIFAPFRASSGYTEADCKNNFLKDFMAGKRHLTLGSFGIILKSTEPALRTFIGQQIHDAANHVFGATGAVALLNDDQMVHIRNKAAHDEVLTRTEAQVIRGWALGILGQV